MLMTWFLPVSCLLGVAGSRTAVQARHILKAHRQEGSWWLLLVLSWLPAFCWIMAQFVVQD